MTPAITVRPAPDREPPFDDELPPRHLQVVGPWDQPLPFDIEPRPSPGRDFRAASASPFAPASQWARRSPGTAGPSWLGSATPPEQWGRRFLVALLECAAGRRSLSQLSRHAALPVIEGFRNDAAAWARIAPNRRPGVVRTVRAFEPTEGCAEFSAVIQVGPRFRAVAARFEQTTEAWRCTRLQIG